jgi:hypothetical protein
MSRGARWSGGQENARQNPRCGRERCWQEQAHVAELTGLLREGPGGDQLAGWPPGMRIFAAASAPTRAPN